MTAIIRTVLIISCLIIATHATQLFDSCSSHDDCTRTIDYTVCAFMPTGCGTGQRVCLCNDGYRAFGYSRCLKEAKLGETCDDNTVCVDASSTCVASRCECRSGYHRNPNDPKSCQSELITAQYGDSCSESSQCDPTQECLRGKCSCLSGYKYSEDLKTCTEIRIGDPCRSNDDCITVFNAVCAGDDAQHKVCACYSGFLATPISLHGKETRLCLDNSLELRDAGQPCIDDIASDAFCKPSLTCTKCPHNFRNSVCTRSSTYVSFAPTTPAPTVAPQRVVTDAAPTQPVDYYEYEDTTPEQVTVKIETTTMEPTTTLPRVETVTDEYEYYDETEKTVKPTTVTTTAPPATAAPEVTTSEIDYEVETTEEQHETTTPLKVVQVPLNADCAPPSVVCGTENSECFASRCQCVDGYEQLGDNYCHQIGLGIPLGQSCLSQVDRCATAGAICANGICQCPRGYKPGFKDDCVENIKNGTYDSPCEHSVTCFYGLSCVNYRCRCIAGTKQVADYDCVPRTLGEACPSGYDSACKFIKNGGCRQGNCDCKEGYVRKNANECVEAIWVQSGDESDEREKFLVCNDNLDCIESMVAPKKSVCIESKCQCRPGYTLNEGKNLCSYEGLVSDEGYACDYNTDCHTAGLKCVNNKCVRPVIMSSTNVVRYSSSLFVLTLVLAHLL